ncbi:glucose-6-phosphate 1-dehydrogenase [Spiribacter salinus M19-40]|uniref:Glucose-6-phosphate 1-dehydrogenase n=2 Tax=Spiribacter salinus TaxID=1335746 RepID=R4V4E2_9GAMM|nr:glucose-6-phosphate dehydrogenase [Spiribacter salinus]AGM40814.1 glucose-6-phosphate 1-dehydrogenase [Spiribacter salinus M19-40]TQF00539.1 MAG: glucose-6-phosphate dehydrogenase [Spiribacter salinus]
MESLAPFDLVLFGATGDLSMRKLLPALYRRHSAGQLPDNGRIIATARSELDRSAFIERVRENLATRLAADELTEGDWQSFTERLQFVSVDASEPRGFADLAEALAGREAHCRVFYLAVAPRHFVDICEHLNDHGLVSAQARVVLEKPLGHDLASAQAISERIGAIFAEDAIYRIDHYLGKETVQNLMALRFGNMLFEPLWRRDWVRDVQISVAEQVGVSGRAGFYDRTGALRDMVQNHLLQLLCIIAMEPPTSIEADAVRDEKLKVLRALTRLEGKDALRNTVRGQYRAGAINGQPVSGYLDEEGVPGDSRTETFVALRTELANWRWAGVPFYLRTGKRLQERTAEIVVNFRDVPHSIFHVTYGAGQPNRLVIRLQPDEGVRMHMMAKSPGDQMELRPVALNLDFAEAFQGRQADAYERLLMDVLRGRLTLFMRRDELYSAWDWIEPILQAWDTAGDAPKPYTAGTWGPAASSALLGREDASWHEES